MGAINCDGTHRLGCFWSAALDWPLVWDQDEETAIQAPSGGSKITWSGPPLMPRQGRDRLQLDVIAGADSGQVAEVQRLLSLGASHPARAGERVDRLGGVILLDPDGNQFCVAAGR